ncbi:MAG: LysR family carnitine catabolism transcriptional activator [Psychrobacter glaciei]|jgi:LysR family carnitine catabolism transcriptional activator
MNVTIKQVRLFVEVARTLSFARAAKAVHLSQPAVSLAIQSLEENIGGRLFERSTRSLELTPEGKAFYPTATRLLNEWTEALKDVNNLFTLQRGKLNMAVMPSFSANVLPAIVRAYHKKHPQVNLSIQNIVMDEAIESVKKGRNELAVSFASENMNGLKFTPLYDVTFMAVYSDHFLAQLTKTNLTTDWSALFDLPMVAMDKDSTVRRWLDEATQKHNLHSNIVAEVNQLDSLGQMVSMGLGVGIVPSICEGQMRQMGLHMQNISSHVLKHPVGIVTRAETPLSASALAMVNMLKSQLASG